ncbi:MAG: cation-translocating P-type ATPase [Verrucomicrobia bacterium]|jgi:P-type Cu2+ transporter|nr:cation-translocating P-type ATPase [Verrucomicrobiota bacterium]MBT7699873.1 cation-translocating P-type ATPase [Verrucomicrobiota bacterium]
MKGCELCGRPVLDEDARFCCPGCAAINEIVGNLEVDDAAKQARVKAMLNALFDEPAPITASPEGREFQSLDLMVSGMVCPACAWIIHYCLTKLAGVQSVTINFMSEVCQVVFDPMVIGRDTIEAEIEDIGYGVYEGEAPSGGISLLQLGLGWFYALNAMMLSFIVYSAEFWEVPVAMAWACSLLLIIFTALIIIGPGRATLARGIQQLRRRQFRMDSLITLSTSMAIIYSLVSLSQGIFAKLYFDVVCLLIMLLQTGAAIEAGFYDRVRRRVHALRHCLPKKIHTIDDRFVSIEEATPGMPFAVTQGEVVPTDGILESDAAFDFSHVTGESRAIHLHSGQLVGAGSRLLSDPVTLYVPPGGATSLIDRMIQGTVSAFDTRVEQLSFGDRISQVFVPVVVLVGLIPLVWFSLHGAPQVGLLRLMAALVVACPCAFGIAEPLVLTLAVDRVRHLGIQIFNGTVLRLQPDAIIFDKTGTLTTGDFQVRAIHWLVPENQADLDRLASIEAGLDHPIARALARVGRVIPVTERDVERTTVQGQFDGQQYRAGKTTLYEDLPEALAAKGLHHVMDGDSASTLVAFGDAQSCHLVVELRDEIRPEIPALLKQIPTAHLCSGDRQPMVEAVADRLGIEHRHWDMSIEDKLATIREMQAEGQTVMMVGDGVNDSQALTAADIGLAVLAGEVPAKFSADGAFLVSDLSGLAAFLDTLGELRKRIAQNYLWSFLYNGIGLTLAVSGLLSPTFCAFGMVFSNTVVVANSVRRLKTTQKPLPLPGAC